MDNSTIIAAAPGLPLKVAQRLDDLRAIELSRTCLKTIRKSRYLAAYHSGPLAWNRGTVTFRSHGRNVLGPGKFDWKTLDAVNKEHQGKSIWAEEVSQSKILLQSSLTNGLSHLSEILVLNVFTTVGRQTQLSFPASRRYTLTDA